MDFPAWFHDEFRQIGTDYTSPEEIASYDERMRSLRDVDKENAALLAACALPGKGCVLEIGCGTGAFIRHAAKSGVTATAVDVSQPMLDFVRRKADEEGLSDLRLYRKGFLTFEEPDNSLDAVVSGLALHHLSDVWKQIALRRIFRALKPFGRFVLFDVVFSFGEEDPLDYFPRILETLPGSRANFERHIADEFSTTDRIMRILLEDAGFELLEETAVQEYRRFYIARKPKGKNE